MIDCQRPRISCHYCGWFQEFVSNSVDIARDFLGGIQLRQGGGQSNDLVTVSLDDERRQRVESGCCDHAGHAVLTNVVGIVGMQNAHHVTKLVRPTQDFDILVVVVVVILIIGVGGVALGVRVRRFRDTVHGGSCGWVRVLGSNPEPAVRNGVY